MVNEEGQIELPTLPQEQLVGNSIDVMLMG